MRDEQFEALFGAKALGGLTAPGRQLSLPLNGSAQLSGIDFAQLRGLLLLCLPVLLLWHTPLVYPLKILVVFLHELSHGLMAVLTGGQITRIELSALEGGLCFTAGGNRFLILSAGYLGSLLWGGALLIGASRSRLSRAITLSLGALLLAVALLYVRPLISFGLLFALLAGLGLLYCGLKLGERANGYLLKFIGLTSTLYVPQDIFSDTVLRLGLPSDARLLAELTGAPTLMTGLIWMLSSLGLGIVLLLLACRRTAGPVRGTRGTGSGKAK